MIILVFGTNILHYASGETVTSHPCSFALVAALLPLSRWWFGDPKSLMRSAVLGAVLALSFLTRPTNVLALSIFVFYGVTSLAGVRTRFCEVLRQKKSIAVIVLAGCAVMLPQLWVWHYATGHWIVNPRDIVPEFNHWRLINWNHPLFCDVLLSIKKGVFVFFPALVLMLPGFFFLFRRRAAMAIGGSLFVFAQLYIVASYADWWGGGGFGNRYFLEALVGGAFCIAASVAAARRRWQRISLGVFISIGIAYSLFLMSLYYMREMSYYGMDRQAFFDFFWFRKHMFSLWWNR